MREIVECSLGIGFIEYFDSYFRIFRPEVFSTNLCNETDKGIENLNTVEVIGNIYQNAKLLKQG